MNNVYMVLRLKGHQTPIGIQESRLAWYLLGGYFTPEIYDALPSWEHLTRNMREYEELDTWDGSIEKNFGKWGGTRPQRNFYGKVYRCTDTKALDIGLPKLITIVIIEWPVSHE